MTEFWDWASKTYGGEGVAEACLALQDEHDQCVTLLLWAAWAAAQGRVVSDDEAQAAVALARPWHADVITPLRSLRRRLKAQVSPDDDHVRLPLRDLVKATELKAEKAVMAQMEAIPLNTQVKSSTEALCQTNLAATIRAWGEKMPPDSDASLIHALTKGDFLRYGGHVDGVAKRP